MANEAELLMCHHCGNRVVQKQVGYQKGQELYEYIHGERHSKDFGYFIYQCPTCHGVSVYGDFAIYARHRTFDRKRLYPITNQLLPLAHKLASKDCIPERILKLYEEIWPLRINAPSAFAGQIRRALELICHDQKSNGRTLFDKLKYLTSRGIFPGYFSEITDLIRQVGNLGSHASEEDLDYWDAELLDDFFQIIVEYVYIIPSRIERLRQRTKIQESQ